MVYLNIVYIAYIWGVDQLSHVMVYSTCIQAGWTVYLDMIVHLDVPSKRSEFLPLLNGSMDETETKHQLPPRHSKNYVERERSTEIQEIQVIIHKCSLVPRATPCGTSCTSY